MKRIKTSLIVCITLALLSSACTKEKQVTPGNNPVGTGVSAHSENFANLPDCQFWPQDNCAVTDAIIKDVINNDVINIANRNEQTPLMVARDVNVVKQLIATGADVNVKDASGRPLLMRLPTVSRKPCIC